nr:histone-lysine N-methyltransferase SETMAR [Haemonchus contortus]
MEDEEQIGRPSLVDHDVLLRAMEEDRSQPLRKNAKKMCVSHTVVAAHLELLGIVKKLDKGCHTIEAATTEALRGFKFAVDKK